MARARPADRIYGLDGLRGVAAFVVLLGHASQEAGLAGPANFGLAVDFFFLLSGYVIAGAYGDRLADGALSTWAFMKARVLRLHPLLVVATIITLMGRVAQAATGMPSAPLGQSLLAAAAGVLCIPYHPLSAETWTFPLNLPEWSLFVEYVLNLGFALLAPKLRLSRLLVLVVACAGALVFMAWRLGWIQVGMYSAGWYLGLVRGCFPFFAGALLFRLEQGGFLPRCRFPWLLQAALLLAVLLMPLPTHRRLLEFAAVFLVFPAIIILGRADGRLAKHPIFLWIGALSYPLYIIHYPILRLVLKTGDRISLPSTSILSAEVIAAIGVATFAMYRVDMPLQEWRRKRRAHQRFSG